jgi:hypothetical protein
MSNFAHMGIDDRATMKGLRRNDFASNINAFSINDRKEDEYYYRNMPMNTEATDPVNTRDDKLKQTQLRDALMQRIRDISGEQAMDAPVHAVDKMDVAPATLPAATATALQQMTPTIHAAPYKRRMVTSNANMLHNISASWEGLFDDLQRWQRLPAVGSIGKLRHVLTNENRFSYIMGVIVIVLLIIVAAHFIMK